MNEESRNARSDNEENVLFSFLASLSALRLSVSAVPISSNKKVTT
jgi:hypothetical protein